MKTGLQERALGWLAADRKLRDAALRVARSQQPAPPDLASIEEQHANALAWAREGDPDLASLRELPAFQAIFAEQAPDADR